MDGEASQKQKLLELATQHGVARVSAENGLDVKDAIRVIEGYSSLVSQAAFPKDMYNLLT